MPLVRAAMHAQYEAIHVAQWPAVKELHQLASRHYAFEGQCFVLAAGCILSRGEILEGYRSLGLSNDEAIKILEAMPGDDDDLILNGGSALSALMGAISRARFSGKPAPSTLSLSWGVSRRGISF